ncbi:hypothetical protein ABLE68_18515 [Nocardioides sp. CN2-186]|uniref:hypothetical protein n=1 Tax=Nocardioides tweenelious TaxID=3156607 RepID=UPI0032B45F85
MIEYGRRAQKLPAPPRVVWESLAEPRRLGARPWLSLVRDEVDPTVLEAAPPERIVWSSLWPDRPDDRIVFTLTPVGMETSLEFALLTPEEAPDQSTTGYLRKRMNFLLFADLRFSYGQ